MAAHKRKRESDGKALTQAEPLVIKDDLACVSEVWKACFGKDGNFTVVVEEASPASLASPPPPSPPPVPGPPSPSDAPRLESVASSGCEAKRWDLGKPVPPSPVSPDLELAGYEVKRTEFKVWASLLAQRSPVLETMICSDGFEEGRTAQLVIRDFSAAAVENFLCFLYSGLVKGTPGMLVELLAMADKYQVEKLRELCLQAVTKALQPEVACEIFAASDHFHMPSLRTRACDLILIHPEKALKTRPEMKAELLEEILGTGVLCIEEASLRRLLEDWRQQSPCWEADALRSVVETRIRSSRAREVGVHSSDVLATLWTTHGQPRPASGGYPYRPLEPQSPCFLGYWVVVILGPKQQGVGKGDANVLQRIAANQDHLALGEGWVSWMLPHSHVYLMGFSLGGTSSAASFEVLCSEDGATWHVAFKSCKEAFPMTDKMVTISRPPFLVKWFKLHVLQGTLHARFNIHGIWQKG